MTALRLCGALQRFWRTRGYLGEGRQWCMSALASAGASGGASERARVLNVAGVLANFQADYALARAYFEQSLAILREIGDRQGIAASLNGLGLVSYNQGDYASGRAYYEQSLAILREIGDRRGIAMSLDELAGLAAAESASERGAKLWGAAEALREEIGWPLPPSEQQAYERDTSATRTAMGAEAFDTAWAQGRETPIEQIVAELLHE